MDLLLPAPPGVTLRRPTSLQARELDGLAEVLVDCVAGGASVSFMAPLEHARARAYWQRIGADIARGERALLLAEDANGVIGTVHLVLALPENQPHRADVSKLLVHRRGRRRGVAAALMQGVDVLARACGRRVLVLDTVTGSDAERLYTRLGWQRCGVIPEYALMPDGTPCATTYFYRTLAA